MAITFQRAGGSGGTQHTIDIGAAGNDRLVVVFLDDESNPGNAFQGTVSIGSNNAEQGVVSNNPDGAGNHLEIHYFTESDLGSLNGSQTITFSGGDSGWAMHVQVFYGVSDATFSDSDIDNTSIAPTDMTVTVDVPAGGIVVAGAAQGSNPSINMQVTSPMTETTDENDGTPQSAVLCTAYAIESSAQTAKTYTFDPDATQYRNSAAALVFAAEPEIIQSDLEGYRWRDDDGNETGASWLLAQDTSPLERGVAQTTRLRILIDDEGDAPTGQTTLQYKRADEPDTEWRNV